MKNLFSNRTSVWKLAEGLLPNPYLLFKCGRRLRKKSCLHGICFLAMSVLFFPSERRAGCVVLRSDKNQYMWTVSPWLFAPRFFTLFHLWRSQPTAFKPIWFLGFFYLFFLKALQILDRAGWTGSTWHVTKQNRCRVSGPAALGRLAVFRCSIYTVWLLIYCQLADELPLRDDLVFETED